MDTFKLWRHLDQLVNFANAILGFQTETGPLKVTKIDNRATCRVQESCKAMSFAHV